MLSQVCFVVVAVLSGVATSTKWQDSTSGFHNHNSTRCSGHYTTAGRGGNVVDCEQACEEDSRCASYSVQTSGDGECFLYESGTTCSTEESWISGHKDTRCTRRPEGSAATLKCPYGSVISEVVFASYGTPEGYCGQFKRSSCHSTSALETVKDLCLGEETCVLSANDETFGSPCVGKKNLAAEVKCAAGPKFHEDVYFNKWSSQHWDTARKESASRKFEWKNFLANVPSYPVDQFSGKGIIIVAGGKYLQPALVMIDMLRQIGCKLRIQVWHNGEEEMTFQHRQMLQPYNVETRNFKDYVSEDVLKPIQANVGLRLFQLKPLALLHSDFEEMMLLDSDNCPVRDPSYLFDTKEFTEVGSLFWPDYWKTSLKNPIWDVMGVQRNLDWEQESGQLLIKKESVWKALNLCVHFNSEYYMQLLNGDKDTFRFAWLATKTPFSMIKDWPAAVGTMKQLHTAQDGFCGHTMLQHDTDGKPLFIHHNQLKNTYLPFGENFKFVKTPSKDEEVRAVPVAGMDLLGNIKLPCTDFDSVHLKNVDEPSGEVSLSDLSQFEVMYMEAQEKLSGLFGTHEAPKEERSRRALSDNVTNDCPPGQYSFSTVECEVIADCDADQTEEAAPVATADRFCRETIEKHETVTVSVVGNRFTFTDGVTTITGLKMKINNGQTYKFVLDSAFVGEMRVTDENGVMLTSGIINNGAKAGEDIIVSIDGDVSRIIFESSESSIPNVIGGCSDPTYSKDVVGTRTTQGAQGLRFSTAYNANAITFTQTVESHSYVILKAARTKCKAECIGDPACKGIHIYKISAPERTMCHGLNDLGRVMSTNVDSQGWTKSAKFE